MTFEEVLDHAIAMLQRRGRVSYRAFKAQFHLDEDLLETLKEELVVVHQVATDQDGTMLVWTGDAATTPEPSSPIPTTPPASAPEAARTQEREPPTPLWNEEPTSPIERARVGNSPSKGARAAVLSRHGWFWQAGGTDQRGGGGRWDAPRAFLGVVLPLCQC